MKKTITSVSVAILALFGAQAAMAQAASSPSRAEVKAQAADANKKGSNVPDAAMGSTSPKAAAATSTTTRADRKATTADANKKGAIADSGTGAVPDAMVKTPKTSTKARADVKKETADANKAGAIQSGEVTKTKP